MVDLLKSMVSLIVRLGLLAAGLVFFASMVAVVLLLLGVWLARALWARLTGQPVQPWAFRFNRRPPWQRTADDPRRTNPSDDVMDVQARDVSVVTDVEPKRIEPPR